MTVNVNAGQTGTRTLQASSALNRYLVLDLTRVRSGPTCVRQLADWGADVIKIESPSKALQLETAGPRSGPDFQNLHRNKRSLTLNLKSDDGMKIFRQLADKADVIVENFRPDVKNRLGIDYDTLAKTNKGLVYASISGFGQDGPLSKRPGFDQIAQGMGGLMSITGAPGEGPMRVGIPIADLCAGLFAAQGVLIALLERAHSGKGQWIQTSLLQAQLFMLDFQAARYLMDGDVPKQAGNYHPTIIPTGVFQTSNGCINIQVGGEQIWHRFAKVLDRPDWLNSEEYNTLSGRSQNCDALYDEINAITITDSTENWVAKLIEADVPCGEINDIRQAFESPQVKHLGIAMPVNSNERGQTELVGQPIIMSRTPSAITAPPPLAGGHCDDILASLGYSAEDVARFRDEKTI